MIGWRAAAVVATVATSVMAPPAASLQVTVVPSKDARVVTFVRAAESWTPEVRELLQTGAYPVSFTYEIELRKPSTLWFDSTLGHAQVVASAKHDTLTGAYQVTKHRDGNIVTVERRSQESEIRDWLTVVEQVTIEPESPLRPNNDYYVTVQLYITPRRNVSILYFLPGGSADASGRHNFTFIR